MPLRGSRIPFLGKPPVTAGGEDRFVKLFPVQEEVANGRMGLEGQWLSRPGYEVRTNLDSTRPVVHLAAHQGLVAVTDDGKVFRSHDEEFRQSYALEGAMNGHRRPQSVEHDGELVVVDGGEPMLVETDRVRRLGIPSIKPGVPGVEATNKGDVPAGVYKYYVSMQTIAGESLLGPASSIITHLGKGKHGTRATRPAMTDDERKWVIGWSLWRGTYEGNEILFIAAAALDTLFIDDTLEQAVGGPPTSDTSASTPPKASEVAVVGDYVVLAGQDRTEFQWSSPGNHDYYPGGNTTSVQLTGGGIQTIRGVAKELLIFRTKAVDIFSLVAGIETFARRLTFPRGCLAKSSVVMEGGSHAYWLGNDHIFYRVVAGAPEPIGILEQGFVKGLQAPADCRGEDFPTEHVVRWFFDTDRVCMGYSYLKGHFFRDWSWDGAKQTPLDVHAVVEAGGETLVGLSGGQIGVWGQDYTTDGGGRIRTIRRFTVPLTADGKQARVNSLVFRHERGTSDVRGPQDIVDWQGFHDYVLGDKVLGISSSNDQRVYQCVVPHTSGGVSDAPGHPNGTWTAYWIDIEADERPKIVVRWGFDQGPEQDSRDLSVGVLGETAPYVVIGPCGMGREIWIEMERSAKVPCAFTGGAIIAQPLGDGM